MNRIHRDRFGRITIVGDIETVEPPAPEVERVEPVADLEHDDDATD